MCYFSIQVPLKSCLVSPLTDDLSVLEIQNFLPISYFSQALLYFSHLATEPVSSSRVQDGITADICLNPSPFFHTELTKAVLLDEIELSSHSGPGVGLVSAQLSKSL